MTLEEAIKSLPDTSSTVATFLKQESCKGLRYYSGACPLANYLSKKTGKPIIVGANYAVDAFDLRDVKMFLPNHLSDFVYDFDMGAYPELVEN